MYKKLFIDYVRMEHKGVLCLVVLLSVCALCASIVIPILQSEFIDSVVQSGFSVLNMVKMAAVSMASVLVISCTSMLPAFLMLKYEMTEKLSLIKRIQFVSAAFLKSVGSTGLYYGIKNIGNDLSFIAYPALLNVAVSTGQAVIALLFLTRISQTILYAVIIMWSVSLSIVFISTYRYKKYVKILRAVEPELSADIHAVFSQSNIITKFGRPSFFMNRYNEKLSAVIKIRKKMDNLILLQSVFLSYIKVICFAVFIIISLPSIFSRRLTQGALIMLLSYIPLLLQPLSKYKYFFKIKRWIEEGFENKGEFLSECTMPSLQKDYVFPNVKPKNTLQAERLCFSYTE